jgi:superfamily II DNA or RNA helicase
MRLSTGRAVSPLKQPGIANARDVGLAQTAKIAFPRPEELQFGSSLAILPLDADLPAPMVMEFSIGLFDPPENLPLAARLMPASKGAPFIEYLAAADPEGGTLVAWPVDESDLEAAGDLPFMLVTAARAGEGSAWLAGLRPLLEPPVAPEEPPSPPIPDRLRGYQQRSLGRLMQASGMLLADQPGSGKTVSAVAAIYALFQRREIGRVLIVVSPAGFRHWVRHLRIWAPGLQLAVVRGQAAARAAAWSQPAQVWLTDYQTLVEDIGADRLRESERIFDLLVLDSVHELKHGGGRLRAIKGLQTGRRWGLAGDLPQEASDYLMLFNVLAPQALGRDTDKTLPDLRRRLADHVLRHGRSELAGELPRLMRQEIWLDLGENQARVYQAALAEERQRLVKLGESISRTHVNAAVDRLKQVCNFLPDTFDGIKVHALVDLLEEISACGGKTVVFSQFRADGTDSLSKVLEAYGCARLEATTSEENRVEALSRFRQSDSCHVLLADIEARTDGLPMSEASYVIHFDHGWNPAVRRRAEQRLHPSLGPEAPIIVYEFWIADSIEVQLHELLRKRGLLARDIAQETRPVELEDRLTVEDWLQHVFEITRARAAQGRQQVVPLGGALPGTGLLRRQLESLSPVELMRGVALLMEALGYPESQLLATPSEAGGDMVASGVRQGQAERVLVRCVRSQGDVGVGEARELMKALVDHPDCIGAYLVSVTDFTPSCKKYTDKSGNRLGLLAGAELHRHLHILGWM